MPKPSCQLQTRHNKILQLKACVQCSRHILIRIISKKKGASATHISLLSVTQAANLNEAFGVWPWISDHQTLVITTAMTMMRLTAKLVGE